MLPERNSTEGSEGKLKKSPREWNKKKKYN